MTTPTAPAAPRNTEEQLVRPDFGSVLEFCVRERAAITYAFDILEAMGGEIMPKMDTLEGIMFRVMKQAHTLRANSLLSVQTHSGCSAPAGCGGMAASAALPPPSGMPAAARSMGGPGGPFGPPAAGGTSHP